MFTSARLKLTAWYLLIIMFVSGLFSLIIYKQIDADYKRIETGQKIRQENMRPNYEAIRSQLEAQGIDVPPMPVYYDPAVFREARIRLEAILFLINLGVLAMAGLAGYFLAGRTLRPIKEMVDEQNRFITDASHELRTPLTALKTSMEVGLREKRMVAKDVKELLESNLEEVGILQYLCDNLIKLTQYQQKVGMYFTKISVAEVTADAVKRVSNLAKAKNIKLINSVDKDFIQADKMAITELLVIFLDNAIKYSNENTEVILSSKESNQGVTIEVADQGIGIDEKDIGNLFKRFYRSDKSRTKTSVSGYGLGLSIAKKIVDSHQGNIDVSSTLGHGSTFKIFLPKQH
jgi:two-component system sensor histidine kinase CiaH